MQLGCLFHPVAPPSLASCPSRSQPFPLDWSALSPPPCSPSSRSLQRCIVGNSQVFPPPSACLPPSSLRKSQLPRCDSSCRRTEVRDAAGMGEVRGAGWEGRGSRLPRQMSLRRVTKRNGDVQPPAQGECPPPRSRLGWRPGGVAMPAASFQSFPRKRQRKSAFLDPKQEAR